MLDYVTFVNSNAINVMLDADSIDAMFEQFEQQVVDKHEGFAATDLGAVKVYLVGSTMVAWLDYEMGVGYIA